ncbi:MAG: SRPBCC family protein [Gemmatimonadaceae bacterium]
MPVQRSSSTTSNIGAGARSSFLAPVSSLVRRMLASREHVIEQRVWVRHPLKDVFPFFAPAENLERLTPPEVGFRIMTPLPIEMKRGALIDYTIKLFGFPLKWRTEITAWNPPNSFEDTQLRGPYAKWVHTHSFVEESGGTTIEDRVVYALPFGVLGGIAHPIVARQLKRIFSYREKVLTARFQLM